VKLFIVGGFLGSGKTTAIKQAAHHLHRTKKKVGIITNDQGKQQVDTQFIRSHNIPVEEVSNGCFCCNFQDLDSNIKFLKNTEQPDIIFAESVGSCTDLVATVINPFLHLYDSQFEMVFSVFADVQLLLIYLQRNKEIFYENVNYIYGKQLEEADIIIVNKIDLLNEEQLKCAKQLIEAEYDGKTILYQNSLDKESIQYWITTICDNYQNSSLRPSLQLDYTIYGAGEAELGWLNEEIGIVTSDTNAVAAGFILINKIYDKIIQQGYPIGHLKFLMNDGQQKRKISFTTIPQNKCPQEPNDFKTDRIVILINARVQTKAILVKEIISDSILELEALTGCKVIESKLEAFQPGYPNPTHRIQSF
jgi:Ni2+-binding GTPase involved in maturation of urease and hydrogenase